MRPRGAYLADPKRLAQAIGQVLDNAIRYNSEGGEVLLFARWQSDQLEIIVADNGPGIGAKSEAGAQAR